MGALDGKVAWVTGAGTGIGQAAAISLASEGAMVVLTGRRKEPLEATAATIKKAGGKSMIQAGDMMKSSVVNRIAKMIEAKFRRCDILINNAGLNIADRSFKKLTPEGVDMVVGANLSSAFYCVLAVLPMMRRQKGGLMVHTASWAGRWPGLVSGSTYNAAKHGVIAMSHTINMEECGNGIRSCAFCPGEVATPILDKRPVPVSKEDRAKMVQSEDCGDLIRYIACMPEHVVINELVISPTHNRGYIASLHQPHVKV